MIKIFNNICFHLKNIILPIILAITIYIIMFMFKRLEKDIFVAKLMEFISVIFPFLIYIILSIINLFYKQNNVRENTFYNVTSVFVVITIAIFCYRTIMDENMLFWHKYGYKMNFNYFADQLAAVKIMLYGLSIADVLLIISDAIKIDNNKTKKKSE